MQEKSDRTLSRIVSFAVVTVACASLGTNAYVVKRVGEAQEASSALKTELAVLCDRLAEEFSRGQSVSGTPSAGLGNGEVSAALQVLRQEIGALASSVGEMQIALQKASANRSDIDNRGALAPDFQPLPALSPPWLGANPGSLIPGGDGASSEMRETVDAVLRDHAERARQKIEALSADPMRPDFEVVARVMKESDEEVRAELRAIMPPKDYEAFFPPELRSDAPVSQDNP